MKTIIHFFNDYNAVKKDLTALNLPDQMQTDKDTFDFMRSFDGIAIQLDTSFLYHNFWVNEELQYIIPDYARLPGTKKGFYLEQTTEMQELRSNTKQCSYCNTQYFLTLQSFCPECIGYMDVPEDQLYRTFLRPVSTFNIHLTPKSIQVPKFITEKHTRIPELTYNGQILNL